jgi:Ran GTPase-activating protein (RanGAP) involved in mRNA processing and transport
VGGVKIAEYLEGNPPIQSITIDHNQLNDDDAILISQALKRNTNLKTIDIHSNIITSIGVKALLTCVFDSSSLNAISESNHILVSMNIFNTANIVSQKLNGYVRTLLKLGKRDKIFLALQDKDSLLKYLANVPVELIPEVLAFRQRVVDQQVQRQLNIVYSTMRWWNMPMLYLYRSCVKSDTKRKRDN